MIEKGGKPRPEPKARQQVVRHRSESISEYRRGYLEVYAGLKRVIRHSIEEGIVVSEANLKGMVAQAKFEVAREQEFAADLPENAERPSSRRVGPCICLFDESDPEEVCRIPRNPMD